MKALQETNGLPVLLTANRQKLKSSWDRPQNTYRREWIPGQIAACIENLPMTIEEVIRFLQMRIHQGQEAASNAASLIGRAKNRFSGDIPHYARLPGQIITYASQIIGQEVPEGLSNDDTFLLRIDHARSLLDAVKSAYQDYQAGKGVVNRT